MRILIFGAGVLGSFYGAKLASAGHDVTVLARGSRAEQIREHGLVVEERGRATVRAQVRVITALSPDDAYDYVLVLVRGDQVASALPQLAASTATPNVVFMYNNASGPDLLAGALGAERVILGFPGAGGERADNGTVRATVVLPFIQKTTVGELDGTASPRVRELAAVLRRAGFPTAVSRDMDSWLKTHVALVCPIAEAFYAAADDLRALAADTAGLTAMLRQIRDGFARLRALGIPVTPRKLRALELLPEWLLVPVSRAALKTAYADLIVARHARTAREEMALLSTQLRELLGTATGV